MFLCSSCASAQFFKSVILTLVYLRTLSLSLFLYRYEVLLNTHTYTHTHIHTHKQTRPRSQRMYQNRAHSSLYTTIMYYLESSKPSSLCVCANSQHIRQRAWLSGVWNRSVGKRFFSSPTRPAWLWGSTHNRIQWIRVYFPRKKRSKHLHLGLYVPSWRGQGNVYFNRTTELNTDTFWAKGQINWAYILTTVCYVLLTLWWFSHTSTYSNPVIKIRAVHSKDVSLFWRRKNCNCSQLNVMSCLHCMSCYFYVLTEKWEVHLVIIRM